MGVALLHPEFEGFQIELAHGLFIHPGEEAVRLAIRLLFVADEVFEGHDDLLRLGASRDGRSQLAGQVRVLREVLEVPAAQRAAPQVAPGRVPDFGADLTGFPADRAAEGLGQGIVPGTGQ